MTRALYPGTFDPIHNGHIDIATRASQLFDEVSFAVYATPPKKQTLFTLEERQELAREALAHLPNVTITTYNGLTVECARHENAQVIIRGLRNVADFEYEHQMGWANSHLAPDIELCCLFCKDNYAYLSASILKEAFGLGGDCQSWVPEHVFQALQQKLLPERANYQPNLGREQSKLAHHS